MVKSQTTDIETALHVDPAALHFMAREKAASDVIELALEGAQRPIITTKFGPESAVLLHLVSRIKPDIPVIWVDTGFNTKATMDYARYLAKDFSLNLFAFAP